VLSVPYTLSWNYDFIVALNETMELLQDNNYNFLQKAPSNVITMAKNPKNLLLGERKHYRFNDIPFLDNIKQTMDYNRALRLMLKLSNVDGNVIFKGCWTPSSTYYSSGIPGSLVIYGNMSEESMLQLNISPEYNKILQQSRNIEVSVVPKSKC
jgi:hypothetical protein